MGAPDNSKRDELNALLEDEEIRKDIGVANYLISTYAEGATLPGDILNWAARFDIVWMHHAKEELQGLKKPYFKLADVDAAHALDDVWAGSGANAFVERWRGLARHIGTEEGLLQYLEDLRSDLDDLIQGAENIQAGCINAINENLKGLRKKYCEALIAYSNGDAESATDTFTTYAGTGVTVGGTTGPWGAAIGGLLGGLVGVTKSFNDHTGDATKKELAEVDSATDFKGQVHGLSEKVTGSIGDDSQYSRGGDATTEYLPNREKEDLDGDWKME